MEKIEKKFKMDSRKAFIDKFKSFEYLDYLNDIFYLIATLTWERRQGGSDAILLVFCNCNVLSTPVLSVQVFQSVR